MGTLANSADVLDADPSNTQLQASSGNQRSLGTNMLLLSASAARVLRNLRITGPDAYRGDEVGLFESVNGVDVMIFYWANAGVELFNKSANAEVLLTMGYEYLGSGQDPTIVSQDIVVSASSPATQTTPGTVRLANAVEITNGAGDGVTTVTNVSSIINALVGVATTAIFGTVRLGTNGELDSGSSGTRVATIAGIKRMIDRFVPAASTAVRGKVELAVNGELDLGTDTQRVANLRGIVRMVNRLVPNASTIVRGKVELGSNAELDLGTDVERVPSIAGTKRMVERFATVGTPKIFLNTISTDYATGGTGTQQGLTIPTVPSSEWLDQTKIEVESFSPLDGCSKVVGGFHFNWSDQNISSIEALVEISAGVTEVFNANHVIKWGIVCSPNVTIAGVAVSEVRFTGSGAADNANDSDFYFLSAAPVHIPRDAYMLFGRSTGEDDRQLRIQITPIQINT